MKKHSLDILIIINIILALFLFFGDKFITTVDWNIFGSIATVISAIAMIVTAVIMYQGNKISAKSSTDSIHEMREQYKQQKKDTQDREDKKELREYIEKYLMPEVEKFKEYPISADNKEHVQHAINFNTNSFDCLARLIAYSIGSFYKESLKEIFDKIYIFQPIISSHKEYTDNVKIDTYALLSIISNNLYRALIDESSFKDLINQIDRQINNIERSLKPEEKIKLEKIKDEAIKLHNAQQKKTK